MSKGQTFGRKEAPAQCLDPDPGDGNKDIDGLYQVQAAILGATRPPQRPDTGLSGSTTGVGIATG